MFITDMVEAEVRRPTDRNHALLPIHLVCLGLRYVASGSFQQVTSVMMMTVWWLGLILQAIALLV